jgi:hypothetical protein
MANSVSSLNSASAHFISSRGSDVCSALAFVRLIGVPQRPAGLDASLRSCVLNKFKPEVGNGKCIRLHNWLGATRTRGGVRYASRWLSRGGGCYAPRSCRLVLGGKSLSSHWTRGWGPAVDMDTGEETICCPFRESNCGCPPSNPPLYRRSYRSYAQSLQNTEHRTHSTQSPSGEHCS